MPDKQPRYEALMKAFGKAVRHFRTSQGLSQEALADKAGLDRSYMSQIERGIKNATLGSIWRICQAMGVKPSDLLRMTENVEAGVQPPATATAANPVKAAMILVVDDDEDICAAIASILSDAGFVTKTAGSGLEAMRLLATESFMAIVSDVRMNNGNGLELLDVVRRHHSRIPFFFMTGYDDVTQDDARQRGASGLFSKPFDLGNFVTCLRASIEQTNVL